MEPNLASAPRVAICGVDLAWGEKNGDGLCLLIATRTEARVTMLAHTFGDESFLTWLAANVEKDLPTLVMIDAPLVMTNLTGSRAVDRLTHRHFHREHAGCYPANLGKCPRPFRLGQALCRRGYSLGWDLLTATHLACEVYPHPAMVRLFELDRIVKYKKGAVTEKKKEFARLQALLLASIARHFPQLSLTAETKELLAAEWTKPAEDRVDALFCALIGYYHWLHRGEKSEVLGDLESGFILLPRELRSNILARAAENPA